MHFSNVYSCNKLVSVCQFFDVIQAQHIRINEQCFVNRESKDVEFVLINDFFIWNK